jgi:hypothetical protein
MAIGTPYAVGPVVSSVSTSSSDVFAQTTSAVAAGDTLIIFPGVRLNKDTSITSVTNDGGVSDATPDVIPAADGFPNGGQNGNLYQIRIYCPTGSPIDTNWTINYDQSPTRHSISAIGIPGVADATPDANHIGSANGSGGTPSATTAGSTPASGDFAIGQCIHVGSGANGETGTPTSGFTEWQDGPVVGSSTPFLHQYVEYEALTGSGAVTTSPTFNSNTGGWVIGIVVYQPAATGGITIDAPLATGAGTAYTPTGSMTATAPEASGAGTAFAPAASFRGDAPEASGTGTAFVPSGAMTALAPEALGAGTAFIASLGGITLSAPLALGAGAALIPSGIMTALAPEAAGAGVAYIPSGAMRGDAPKAHGTGVAFPAHGNVAGPIYHRTFWRHPFVFPWSDKGGLAP